MNNDFKIIRNYQRGNDKPHNTSEKVREIHLRQQNWLKQRAAETAYENTESVSCTEKTIDTNGSSRTKVQAQVKPGKGFDLRSDSGKCLNSDGHSRTIHSKQEMLGMQKKSGAPEIAASYSSEIRSHYCPVCSSLMMAPHHAPMLAVPCGHSICDRCCHGSLSWCPVCECYIESTTFNSVLLQIVTDHQSNRLFNPSRHKANSSSKTFTAQHEDDVENLNIRRVVLIEEQKLVMSTMQEIDQQIKREHLQINNIDREREKINQQIEDLHGRLRTLSEHREEYFNKCKELDTQRGAEQSKLNLLQSTLKHLELKSEQLIYGSSRDEIT